MDALTTYANTLAPIPAFINQPVSTQRRQLANPNNLNPVTKVPERLASAEYVEYVVGANIHNAGRTMLAAIHADIENTDINQVRAQYVKSNQTDALAAITLNHLSRTEQDEADERHEDKKNLAVVLNG